MVCLVLLVGNVESCQLVCLLNGSDWLFASISDPRSSALTSLVHRLSLVHVVLVPVL